MPGVIPYLIRAYCDWIEDNKLTPYLLINTKNAGVIAPKALDANGKMVLNTVSYTHLRDNETDSSLV